ncbi:BPSL0067 family protein [Paracidovorax avenae]|uniref:BPSL0067 family protein n=1 Tax=Paracidovorax avenae TaxID=80867 RepID=UPI001FD2E076|nr:BPSL0067 family protein [Paracidovorax avenae]
MRWSRCASAAARASRPFSSAFETIGNSAGKYGSLPTGNHAAFFISQDPGGIWIMDQWLSDTQKPKVSMRYVRPKPHRKNGDFADPSNNAAAYSVIE